MRRISLILTLAILVFSACAPTPPPQYTVKELTANKAELARELGGFQFTDGVIVYLSEEKGDYLVVTGQPFVTPEEFGDDDFIIVQYPTEGLKIGDVVSIRSAVQQRTVNVEGESVTLQYLMPSTYVRDPGLVVTGQVDIEDPDFEVLIQAIRDDISQQNMNMIIIWYLFLNPNSPISPLNPNRFKSD